MLLEINLHAGCFRKSVKKTKKRFPISKEEKIPNKVYNRPEKRLFKTYRKKSDFLVSSLGTLRRRLLDTVYILWGGKFREFRIGLSENYIVGEDKLVENF